MSFKFEFKQTGTMKDPADIREIVEAAMRGLNRKLKALGATIELTASFDGKTSGARPMRKWHIPDVRGWLIWLFRLKTCPYCFSWSTAVCDRDRYGDGLDCTRAQFRWQGENHG